jgi:hypothetical protein
MRPSGHFHKVWMIAAKASVTEVMAGEFTLSPPSLNDARLLIADAPVDEHVSNHEDPAPTRGSTFDPICRTKKFDGRQQVRMGPEANLSHHRRRFNQDQQRTKTHLYGRRRSTHLEGLRVQLSAGPARRQIKFMA